MARQIQKQLSKVYLCNVVVWVLVCAAWKGGEVKISVKSLIVDIGGHLHNPDHYVLCQGKHFLVHKLT